MNSTGGYTIIALLDGTKWAAYISQIITQMPLALPFMVQTAAKEVFAAVKKTVQGPIYSTWRPGQPGTGKIPVPRRSFKLSKSIKLERENMRGLSWIVKSSGLDAPHNILVHEGTDYKTGKGIYPPRRFITDTFKAMEPLIQQQYEANFKAILNRLKP